MRKTVKRWLTLILIFGLLTTLFVTSNLTQVSALNNGLSLTPPMGWNSWNLFAGNINETLIKGVADAMVSSGMQAAGYQYVNLDDNWMANPARDASGNLKADPTRFPSGMKALADYVHSKGLKIGIYGDHGSMTCMGIPQSGSYGYEQRDANTFASWGIDYLKYDNCNTVSGSNMQTDYTNMSNALLNCGRPIVYSICAWQYQSWMPGIGNLWRTTGDINASWSSILGCMDTNAGLASAAGPGRWNDPDMLEVGNGSLSTDQNKAHFTMWCIMASPLICGNDIRNMSSTIKDILTNSEVIALDQDSAGIQGTRVYKNGNSEVWCKPLGSSNGTTKGVALLNRGTTSSATITVNWSDIGLTGSATVRDLWAKADRGSYTGSYSVTVPAGGVVALKIVGTPAAQTSYEAEAGTLSGAAVVQSASFCSGGAKAGYIGNGSANYVTINNVNASTAGSYTMTIHYVVSGSRPLYVSINGGAGTQLSLSGADWNSVATYAMSVSLNAGNNSVRFYNDTAYAPDVDRIVISGGSGGATPTATKTPTPTTTPSGGGGGISSGHTYKITVKNCGKAVVVSGASTIDGAAVVLYDYADNGVTNDEWTMYDLGTGYYKIINAKSGKAMVVKEASTAAGALITQWTYNASRNDEWRLVDAGSGYYYIVNNLSGMYLDNTGNSTTNGTQFEQWTSNGQDNQKFLFTYLR